MSNLINSVSFLATGSEIVSGEILNTNGQQMAQLLQSRGVSLGKHVVVDDDENNLTDALNYLFKSHKAVIITGGLGPTSDDRTRFVVSDFLGEDLEFHAPTWEWIEERFSLRNIPVTENNRQQALFPKSAKVLPNPLGSGDCNLIIDIQRSKDVL
jgi:nicotinamide-nucleotide amidase